MRAKEHRVYLILQNILARKLSCHATLNKFYYVQKTESTNPLHMLTTSAVHFARTGHENAQR